MPQMGPLPWVAVLVTVLTVLGVSSSVLYYEMVLKSLSSAVGSGRGRSKWVW